MKTLSVLVSGLCLLVVAGCSSIPVKVDEGRIRAKTFSFMEPRGKGTASFADNRADVHRMIQAAITHNLASKGIAMTESGGDITVGYLVVISSNVTTAAIGDYFGYGPEAKALLDKAAAGADRLRKEQEKSRIRNANRFLAGALVVDVIDARTSTLVYRNFAYRELLEQASPEMRAERIQSVINELLGNLRVASPR